MISKYLEFIFKFTIIFEVELESEVLGVKNKSQRCLPGYNHRTCLQSKSILAQLNVVIKIEKSRTKLHVLSCSLGTKINRRDLKCVQGV